MKKIIYFIIIVLFSPIFVFAEEYKTMQLIPVDTVGTVSTEKFTYQDILYNSNVDGNGNTIISFGSITNNSISKVPVSINVLLFDSNQKNIGIVTYCTNKDYGNTYEGFKLEGNQSVPFSIKIVQSKYFVKDKGPRDVKYIAVMDDNKYCKIGGYSNYEGLTVDEISNGINSGTTNRLNLSRYVEELKDSGIIGIILPIALGLMGFIIYGMIINSLYKKMYSKSTVFAYLPITNVFITFRVAFGKIVALIGVGLYTVSVVFVLLGINIMFYIVGILVGIAFLLVIIKLITKKYDLFYLEPSIQTNLATEEVTETVNDYVSDDSQKALDLSYGNADDVSLNTLEEDNTFNVSSGESTSENKSDTLDDDVDSFINGEEDNDEEEDGSDLTNFFR